MLKTTEKLELRDPASLIPSAVNPRVHTERQLRQLRASLREFGFVSPVLIDADANIIAGHAMVTAALAEGMAQVPCVRVEHLTAAQRKAYMIADNKLAESSHWDDELLDACLQDLFEGGFDLRLTGFGEYRLPDALATDAAPDVPDGGQIIDTTCRRGDLWRLGDHRLLCGDATLQADVERVMQGEKAVLLLTDPPYNVDYHGGTAARLSIQNDNMPAERFEAFLTAAFKAARAVMMPGAAFYIWYGVTSIAEFLHACSASGLGVRQYLVWVKNQFVLGRQDYNWQHEPCLAGEAALGDCLYGWDKRASHRWYGGDGQSTVYYCDKPQASEDHPTMKPVELFARQIRSSTKRGDILLDPFCGSGTSILAAESYRRKCRAVELDERNCDVIIRRWEEMTGQKAELIERGDVDDGGQKATD